MFLPLASLATGGKLTSSKASGFRVYKPSPDREIHNFESSPILNTCISKHLVSTTLFKVNLLEKRYNFVGYMKVEEFDPAIRFDKFYLRKIVKICMVSSLRVSRSNENLNFLHIKQS